MGIADDALRGREEDRPALDVACLSPKCRRSALISTSGNHCQVWRGTRKNRGRSGAETYSDFVIKYPLDRYTDMDARTLVRQYEMLRDGLGEIVPEAMFVISCINANPNLFVVARAVNVWFNIANPVNREEAIGLLREYPIARAQLSRFIRQAREWRQGPNPRVIDLYGVDNLIMDNLRQIRYVDSFYVFFFEDMLHLLGGDHDYELEEKIEVSLGRLAYLEDILARSGGNV